MSILGTEAFNIGYLTLIRKGKLEQEDINQMLIAQSAFTIEKLRIFNKMLTKYPEQRIKYADIISEMIEKLRNRQTF